MVTKVEANKKNRKHTKIENMTLVDFVKIASFAA